MCRQQQQLGAHGGRAVEGMGDPLHDRPQPFSASVPLPLRGPAAALLGTVHELRPVARLPVGRRRGYLCAGPPRLPRQGARPRADVLLGAIRAGPPGRAGHHQRLRQAGQRAVATPPAEPGHPGSDRWVCRGQDILAGQTAQGCRGAHLRFWVHQVRRAYVCARQSKPGDAQDERHV